MNFMTQTFRFWEDWSFWIKISDEAELMITHALFRNVLDMHMHGDRDYPLEKAINYFRHGYTVIISLSDGYQLSNEECNKTISIWELIDIMKRDIPDEMEEFYLKLY